MLEPTSIGIKTLSENEPAMGYKAQLREELVSGRQSASSARTAKAETASVSDNVYAAIGDAEQFRWSKFC